jgi:hypothetical protein
MTVTIRDPQPTRPRVRPVLIAAVAGLLWGVATMFLQGILPGTLGAIVANSGAGWAVLAFVAGAIWFRSHWWVVAVAGALVELGLVVGYYGSVIIRYDQDPPSFWAYVWAAVALASGPVFGVAGAWWRGAVFWRHVTGVALLGGLFAGEGVVRLMTLPDRATGWIMVVAGALFPLALGRTLAGRLYGLLAVAPAVALALAAFAILDRLTSVT